jgi:hypothetical protein
MAAGRRTKCFECGQPVYRDKSYCEPCYTHVRRGIPTDVRDVPTRQECERAVDIAPVLAPWRVDPH